MPRPRGIPKYRRHSSGQARVRLGDAVTGRQKDILLGKYGSRESRAEYGRIIEQWESAGRRILDETVNDLSINELAVAYIEQHVNQHYRDIDGNPRVTAIAPDEVRVPRLPRPAENRSRLKP